MNAPLAELFRYNLWANLRLLDTLAGLEDAQLDAEPPAGVYGTVRRTLIHLFSAEEIFLARLSGADQFVVMHRWPEDGWPGFEALATSVERSGEALIAAASATDFDRPVRQGYLVGGKRYSISRTFLLTHAFAHGCQHREQLLFVLAALGLERPDLDGWAYGVPAGALAQAT